jgi:DNA gyrase subunit B
MTPEQLWETTMDPNTRTILQVDVVDVTKADEIFQMLMGGEVPPRKAFIQAHAKTANLDI